MISLNVKTKLAEYEFFIDPKENLEDQMHKHYMPIISELEDLGVTRSEIGEKLGMYASNVTSLCNRLEDRNWGKGKFVNVISRLSILISMLEKKGNVDKS